MPIVTFIQAVNYRSVLANLGLMLRLMAYVMIAPLLVSLISTEFILSIIAGGLGVICFVIGKLLTRGKEPALSGKEAVVVTALAYLLFAVIGAVLFIPSATFLDGFFESMSGFTTTGLTVIPVEGLPATLLFFRAFSQWLGGAGIIVLSLVILLGPGRSAFRLYTSAYGEQNLVGDVKATARVVLVVYSSLTLAGYVAYLIAGAGLFNSLLYVMATVSTGGFSPEPAGASIEMSIPFNILRILFMISGAIGFPAYYLLRRESAKAFLADLQLRYLAVIAFVAALIFLTSWGWSSDRIIPGVFQSVSAITTTGFSVVGYHEWPKIVVLISIFLMFVGGSAGSTAGGLKLFRLIVIVQVIKWVVVRALLPEESEISIKVGQVTITETILRQVLSILGLYMILAALSTLAFVLYGFDLIDSLFESVSAIGTVGLSSGLTASSLPAILKGVLIVDMWAGRLEILPIVIVFYARVWIPKRRKA